MRSLVLAVLLIAACCWSPAAGWGYIFNRFRPEANYNWGYGSAGNKLPMTERMQTPRDQLLEALLTEEIEEQLCEGRRCTANEECCSGHVCVEFDGTSGTCMSSIGLGEGAECRQNYECRGGLVCDLGSCVEVQGTKRYNEPCSVSSECDIGKGLCCQVIHRHRQRPKTLCGYFKDPMICVGHVAVDQVQHIVDHTKGEKRLTGKFHNY